MIVFKNYFKVLRKHKGIIILYIGILLLFMLFSQTSNNTSSNFSATKPDIAIINLDSKSKIIDNFYNYMNTNTNIIDIKDDEAKDALFYQKVDAIIYIYEGYSNDYLNNSEQNLEVKRGTSASASYVDMLLEKYFKIADIVNDNVTDIDTIISTINSSLDSNTIVQVVNTVDIDRLSVASYFYSYANYSILAICIYVTALILIIFNNKKIKDRTNISSKKSSSITKELYFGNLCFILLVWIFIIILSIIINGKIMFTSNGLYLMLNSFIFMICALSIGFLVGNIFRSENAISAIVNIVALGSSFICGSFIPLNYLPATVVKFSKILPSYWFIKNNNFICTIENFNKEVFMELFKNMSIVFLFAIMFFIIAIIYNKNHKRNN